ncbi:divalent-cation tolerance protein CutA [Corallincola platygyrae]|uniref:Divalent-cation tolerance protein CutA n=1 Tax=Corallincola platygyrae TaxID=1193278 RepID=A0ABW4XN89_9GAMM
MTKSSCERKLNQPCLVLSTSPDEAIAKRLAQTLVEEQLAACVSMIPQITSVYMWQGEIESDTEVQLLIKSDRVRLPALESRLMSLHPYEVPEFLVLDVDSGSEDYLAWLGQSLKRETPDVV